MTRQDLFAHIADTYGITPDYPFEEDFVTAVFRHTGNRKWFAIAMRIPRAKLGLTGEGHVDVVNLKVSPEMIPSLVQESGVFPAYHMNKKHWNQLNLFGSLPDGLVCSLICHSYNITVHSFDVLHGAEQLNVALGGTVRLQSLKDLGTVVKHGGGGMK